MSESFDLNQVLRQAQELGDKMKQVQEVLGRREAEASVGGGMVSATVNGRLEVMKIEIDPRAVDPRDVEMLQDLVLAAVNQAMKRAQEMAQEEMQRATGLPLSGLPGLFGRGDG